MLRIGNERINENALQYVTPNGFAGSVFDLEPATIYEARFVLGEIVVDTSRAPDLGAYEAGRPVPHYGPRP